jgi:hypothetical protein
MIAKAIADRDHVPPPYCTCHDPACRGGGHCVDNVNAAFARRPTRDDLLQLLTLRAAVAA